MNHSLACLTRDCTCPRTPIALAGSSGGKRPR